MWEAVVTVCQAALSIFQSTTAKNAEIDRQRMEARNASLDAAVLTAQQVLYNRTGQLPPEEENKGVVINGNGSGGSVTGGGGNGGFNIMWVLAIGILIFLLFKKRKT